MYRSFYIIIVIWGITGMNPGSLAAQEMPFFHFPDAPAEVISPESLLNEEGIIYIQDRWKFKAGDDQSRAASDYDDSDWETVSTNLTQADLSFIEWNGIGWFRRDFRVHPDLTGKPIAFLVDRHLGASEIYLNGEKMYELGEFSTDPESVVTYSSKKPVPIVFSDDEIQTLAVRFINPEYAMTGRLMGYNGFRFLLGDWQIHQDKAYSFVAGWSSRNMFYIGMLLAFAVIHFLLFVFYSSERRNLYFSVFVGLLAALTYFYFRMELNEHTIDTLLFYRFLIVTEILVLTFAVRFTHSIDKNFTPKYSNSLVMLGVMIGGLLWFYPDQLVWLRELTVLVFVVEIVRSVAVMLYKERGGIWVLGSGVLFFVGALLFSVMINFDLISGNVQLVNMAGSGGLVLSMSIFLSRNFAYTQKNLESKLKEVQVLSRKTLEQERISKEREIERRLLEAENERKTRELEEARALQLSMLPKTLPSVNGYDMSFFMETATEVGGDYYDYSLEQNGDLVLALGDATGHGMKAGIMVAAAKSYFHSFVHESDSLMILRRMSQGLRSMNMRMMYMGLMLVRCRGYEVDIATAGMPPALHYCQAENRVKRITLKGLPLGSHVDFPYSKKSLKLREGDVLLLMSDGLTELFDPERKILGIRRVEQVLKNSANSCSEEIVEKMKQLIGKWKGSGEPEDDITFMVLKIPGNQN
ncbi:MAG: SpoIIE family protein phosphatase [Balneolaceae bacterium]|nr:SpoIIE family protein phosphatase [Balneolaceae bacterium]